MLWFFFLKKKNHNEEMSYSSGSNSRNEPMCLKQILWYKREETKLEKEKQQNSKKNPNCLLYWLCSTANFINMQ